MKKCFMILTGKLLITVCCYGQSLSPTVLASGGGFASNAAGSLSSTFGEMAAVSLSAGANMLTQGFQQADPFVVVPVSLLSFTATPLNGKVHLEWKTIREVNNDHFDLERSANGTGFIKFAIVAAQGNYTDIHTYTAIDAAPFHETWYRLKQVDIDGRFKYSKIVFVRMAGEISISVFPNPVSHFLHLRLTSSKKQNVEFGIFNNAGQLVLVKTANLETGVNNFQWDLTALAGGMYFIRAKDFDLPSIKIIKQ